MMSKGARISRGGSVRAMTSLPSRFGLQSLIILLFAQLTASAEGSQEPEPYAGPIHALFEEDFVDGQARVLLTLRTRDLTGCGELAVSVARAPTEMTIAIAGINRKGGVRLFCAAKEPPAPSARIDLTNDVGHHTLILKSAGRTDTFALDIAQAEVTIRPVHRPGFTQLDTEGKMLRLPVHSMWVDLDYSDEAARRRFRPEAEGLIRALEAMGARRTKPTPGKYAAQYEAWAALDPHAPPSPSFPPPVVEHWYFQYDGTFEALEAIGERWKRYDHDHSRRGAYMSTHIASWHGRYFNSNAF
jgi:hypothetical protein